ncbi:MAG: hypothetical protein ABL901_12820, partial [Hyphomicrobiaceae bacterium]
HNNRHGRAGGHPRHQASKMLDRCANSRASCVPGRLRGHDENVSMIIFVKKVLSLILAPMGR